MKSERFGPWLAMVLGTLYFVVPLIATFEFSLRKRRGVYSFDAYASVFSDSRFIESFGYSTFIALLTIVVGVLLVVPTAYVIRLRMPRIRPIVEFITLLPLVIPAIVIVFGYLRLYNSSSFLPLTGTARSTDLLLIFAYVVLAMPYMYRAVDTGLAGHRREDADRGGREPGRQLVDDPVQGDPAECARRRALRRLPHLRDRHRRVHHSEPAQPAGLRPLSAARRRQQCL